MRKDVLTRWLLLPAVLVVIAGGRNLIAQTATASLQVSATVAAECTATGATLAFGAYSPLASSPLNQITTFTVTCTQGTAPTVGLDLGDNPTGSTRRMANGSDFLAYELYSDSARTSVWGNSAPDYVTMSAAPSSAPRSLTVYGQVAAGQDVPIGSYSDVVTITVTF